MNSFDSILIFGLLIFCCGNAYYCQESNSFTELNSTQLNSTLFNSTLFTSTELVEANWTTCKYENGTEIPTESENVQVYVTNCTRNEEVCNFTRGTNPLLNITFKAKTNSNEIERGILAKMYMSALAKYVNIPYGSLWNPCESMKSLNTSEANCTDTGIQSGHLYNSLSEFKVNQDFPQVSGITVRILFRQKNSSRRISSLRKWDKHPGPLFLCIELPNCSVI